MIARWAVCAACITTLAVASAAWGCTMWMPSPEDELRYQQQLWKSSDAIFLARATPIGPERSSLVPIVSIGGDKPPQRTTAGVILNCGQTPPRGAVIAFAHRIRPKDVPLQPWRWGSWYVNGHLQPHEVVDPNLAQRLSQAAARLNSGAQQ